MSQLPAGMRNNNPGNIKYLPTLPYAGLVGPSVNTDQGDPQAVFNSPEAGMAAMYRLALKKYQQGKTTPLALIAGNMGWTPGNTQAAANVARSAGIGPNDDIGMTDPGRAARFMRALMLQEHGPASNAYTDAQIQAAIAGQIPSGSAAPPPIAPSRPDGPKGQEVYPAPTMGSMAPSMLANGGSGPATGTIPAAVTAQAAQTPSDRMASIFGAMALGNQQQGPQFSPVQIQGPSPEQSMALANFIKSLTGRMA